MGNNSTSIKGPSKRSEEMPSFIVMDIMERAHELEAAGRSIIHMEIGEPDFDTPDVIKGSAILALGEGKTGYTHSLGIPNLREAVARHYNSEYDGVSVSPEQVIITAGTSPALLLIFSALLNPGDEVIMTDPCYACYPNYVRFLGAEPRFVKVNAENSFAPGPDELAAAITKKTKAFIINSPANPTGHTLSGERLKEYCEIADGAGIRLISDEIYHGMSYGIRTRSALEYCSSAVVLNGFSKRYAMPGWRLGYLISPPEFIRGIQKIQQNFFLCANHFVQWAGITALESASAETAAMLRTYGERRKYLLPELRRLGFKIPSAPTGAFYIFADAAAFTADSLAFSRLLLEEAGVAVTPGIDFGPGGEGFIRFSYANSLENLAEGVSRLERYLASSSSRL